MGNKCQINKPIIFFDSFYCVNFFPKSQSYRKTFGIYNINSFPSQCKKGNFIDYFIILKFCKLIDEYPFLQFSDYKPPLFIFFHNREQFLIRIPINNKINNK